MQAMMVEGKRDRLTSYAGRVVRRDDSDALTGSTPVSSEHDPTHPTSRPNTELRGGAYSHGTGHFYRL